ncbi:unnamed protein product [Spirodela intermedia]|uniref:Uncharacterized protein n=1 Tax=Spirodela intermedia TaxID=51605 RepID=A0A7I8J6Q3_SPIIN|nr:unnamed protein product [Spirodela intermedia]CAA6665112.1 unnamed protein product [Spirodela intermedia]
MSLASSKRRLCRRFPACAPRFEAERPGCKFSKAQRLGGVLYGSVGFTCGLIGRALCARPSLVKSAALWGVFLAVSSNTRYQIVNALEQVIESSHLARRVPPVAMAFTVGVRFANNIYGGCSLLTGPSGVGSSNRVPCSLSKKYLFFLF